MEPSAEKQESGVWASLSSSSECVLVAIVHCGPGTGISKWLGLALFSFHRCCPVIFQGMLRVGQSAIGTVGLSRCSSSGGCRGNSW